VLGRSEIHRLEVIADRAWPAAEVEEHDGWVLRFTGDIGRRVNSVTAFRRGRERLASKLSYCEDWYRRRRRPPIVKLTAAAPSALDTMLAGRGYVIDAPTSVEVRELPQPPTEDDVVLSPTPPEGWMAEIQRITTIGAERTRLLGELVDRIDRPTAFAAIPEAQGMAAVGMAVVDEGWIGLFEVAVDPACRRRGHARRIVNTLMAWGGAHGGRHGYLQVETANLPARRLYHRLGFREAYRYWYRVAPG
jgi:ribosomal protein S18 acetylase RimI-like enzyme